MQDGLRNQTTKQTGEFLVAAELCRRGLIATTFTGNVPAYDVVALDCEGRHVVVQVKTINGPESAWQFNIRDYVSVELVGKRQVFGALALGGHTNPARHGHLKTGQGGSPSGR